MDYKDEEEVVEEPILVPLTEDGKEITTTDNSDNTSEDSTPIVDDVPLVSPSTPVDTQPISIDVPAPSDFVPSEPDVINTEVTSDDNNSNSNLNTDTVNVDGTNITEEMSPNDSSLVDEANDKKDKKKKKKQEKKFKVKPSKEDLCDDKVKVICLFPKKFFDLLSFLVIVILAFTILYLVLDHNKKLEELEFSCTPISSTGERALDVNSTIVQDLYKRFKTSILEDYAQPEWDDTMRLYLAFRQLQESDFYTSNCTLFKDDKMEPYTCEGSFVPNAFKVSSLVLEWKKLYGEETPINLDNIKLKNSCIGGYQYIAERDEFVEGYCDYNKSTSFKVTKSLKEATTNGNIIIIKESVKYHENEKMNKPDYLKSGVYVYTFRLDMNYNYVLVSKELEEIY